MSPPCTATSSRGRLWEVHTVVGSLGGDADGLVGSHLHPGVRRGRGRRGSLEPEAGYGVVCSAQFSGGWSVSDSTPVEGTPPG